MRELQSDVEARRQNELLAGAGGLLGAILGGRRGSTGLRHAANRRNQTTRTAERLETADDRLSIEREQLADLEADLARGCRSHRREVGRCRVLRVDPLRLLWLPVSDHG